MNGIEAVGTDRRMVESIGGWRTAEDSMTECEMISAAVCYADLARIQLNTPDAPQAKLLMKAPPKNWPWPRDQWVPSGIAKNNVRKAAALLVGEWDRVDRSIG